MNGPVDLTWRGLVDADRLHRYYGYLAGKLERQEASKSYVAAVASAIGIAFLQLTPQWGDVVVSIALAIAGAISLHTAFSRQGRKAVQCAILERRFAELSTEWEDAWARISDCTEEDAIARWRALQGRMSDAASMASVDIPDDNKLRARSEDEAYSYRKAVHGSAAETPAAA